MPILFWEICRDERKEPSQAGRILASPSSAVQVFVAWKRATKVILAPWHQARASIDMQDFGHLPLQSQHSDNIVGKHLFNYRF